MNTWLLDKPEDLLWAFVSAVVFYFFIIVGSRLVGLRSFSTISSFDFIITLATGALLATTILSEKVSLLEGTVALVTLYGLQMLIAWLRTKWKVVRKLVDNQPLLLMDGPIILEKNLRLARITQDELIAKLRANNINSFAQVNAVVLESSGTISVLKKVNTDHFLDPALLSGVERE